MSKHQTSRGNEKVAGNGQFKKKKIKEAFEEYIQFITYAKDLKERTIKEHKNNFRYFCEFLKKIGKKITYVDQVNQDLCINYWIYMKRDQNLKNATRRLRTRSLKAQFYFYFKKGYIGENPWIQEFIDLNDEKEPVRYLKKKEVLLILNSIDTSTSKGSCTKSLISTLLDAGVRINEALNLDEADIDFDRNLIHIWESKNDEERYAPINRKLAFMLKELLKKNSKIKNRVPALFINHHDGTRLTYDQVKNEIKKIRKETGVYFTPHSFRHTFAVWYLVHGGDLASLMENGGWKTLKAVKKYLNVSKPLAIEQHKKHSPFNQLTE
ncbi:tyrosine-type recombinase/integrase [Neobacillus vireti]|uniref:tyrosine-type recombinase/integrase n=1 Tax=Neobacillus vireti TaxID=220686 RepID=UPI003000A947